MDFSRLTVLCIGDVMLDRFLHGDIERISPEAPVPVIRLRETREMLGGVGNVASNIASLGGRAVLVGLVGRDDAAAKLRQIVAGRARIVAALVETTYRPTICKTRFVAGRQQVVRADEESRAPMHPDEEAALVHVFDQHIGGAQAVILSDYGKGVLSRGARRPRDCRGQSARRAGVRRPEDRRLRAISGCYLRYAECAGDGCGPRAHRWIPRTRSRPPPAA